MLTLLWFWSLVPKECIWPSQTGDSNSPRMFIEDKWKGSCNGWDLGGRITTLRVVKKLNKYSTNVCTDYCFLSRSFPLLFDFSVLWGIPLMAHNVIGCADPHNFVYGKSMVPSFHHGGMDKIPWATQPIGFDDDDSKWEESHRNSTRRQLLVSAFPHMWAALRQIEVEADR